MNFLLAPRVETLLFTDGEFTPASQLERERNGWYVQKDWGLALFSERLGVVHFACVAKESRHWDYLSAPWNIRGSIVDTSCEPLDLSDRPVNLLHPGLITEDVAQSRAYIASDPSYQPSGEWAMMVKSQDNTYVLVHLDTLIHLGLVPEEERR